jgi:GNAT superfamily N-acetyltransferase
VLPTWRRRGIGSALYERALEHVANAPRAFAFTGEDGRAFAERHGYRLTQTSRISGLDPRAVDTSELDRTPVELRTLEAVGPEATFAVDSVAVLDIPFDEPLDNVTYEQWRRSYWESPDFDFASSYAACVDHRPVAVSYVAVDLPGARAVNAFTGTLPEYRGRGLARTVKLAVIRRLSELGVSSLLTDNHDENAPMLAVNERLGFRPQGAHYSYLLERSGNGLRASAGST